MRTISKDVQCCGWVGITECSCNSWVNDAVSVSSKSCPLTRIRTKKIQVPAICKFSCKCQGGRPCLSASRVKTRTDVSSEVVGHGDRTAEPVERIDRWHPQSRWRL